MSINNLLGWGIAAALAYKLFLGDDDPTFEDTPIPAGSNVNEQRVITMASTLFERLDNPTIQFIERPRCLKLEEYYKMVDAEFIAVANYYKNSFNITIRQSLANLTFTACAFWETDYQQLVLDRFSQLNIP